MLVGNKLDKAEGGDNPEGWEVSEQDGRSFADTHKLMFTETSALENTNVESAFIKLLEKIDTNRQS